MDKLLLIGYDFSPSPSDMIFVLHCWLEEVPRLVRVHDLYRSLDSADHVTQTHSYHLVRVHPQVFRVLVYVLSYESPHVFIFLSWFACSTQTVVNRATKELAAYQDLHIL